MKDHGHISGWSWLCPCGWSTRRRPMWEQADEARLAHLRWHDAQHQLEQQQARA